MKTFKSTSNQKCWGLGLRRSTITESSKWLLWISYGYSTCSWSWGEN